MGVLMGCCMLLLSDSSAAFVAALLQYQLLCMMSLMTVYIAGSDVIVPITPRNVAHKSSVWVCQQISAAAFTDASPGNGTAGIIVSMQKLHPQASQVRYC